MVSVKESVWDASFWHVRILVRAPELFKNVMEALLLDRNCEVEERLRKTSKDYCT
jgi:hypothetical protein